MFAKSIIKQNSKTRLHIEFVPGGGDDPKLTAKQKLFADIWLTSAHFNGTLAAEMAGYKGTRATLAAVAYENHRKPQIRKYIEDCLSAANLPEPAPIEIPKALEKDFAGRIVVRKINSVRRSLSESEKKFDKYLADAVREIKFVSSLTKTGERELVLNCIENACAHTTQEIADDTHLTEGAVKNLVKELLENNLLEAVSRFTVGGSANQTLIFSKRRPCSCV